ncbi:MAG: 16S rRNA processing protein RimM [Dehalococcoidia bacterium]|nr:16S rRNA processing protein RimM [Dehalococcoidia bacterium]
MTASAAPPPPSHPGGPTEPREGFVAVGRVLRPHGNTGELRVAPFNPDLPNLQLDGEVYLQGERRRIERVRWDKGRVLLKLAGLERRGQVEDTRGELLEVAEDELLLQADAYLVSDIVGLEVVREDGRSLGRVSEVLHTGANDVYVVQGPSGETLIPAIAPVVEAVDVANGVLRITNELGLGDESS